MTAGTSGGASQSPHLQLKHSRGPGYFQRQEVFTTARVCDECAHTWTLKIWVQVKKKVRGSAEIFGDCLTNTDPKIMQKKALTFPALCITHSIKHSYYKVFLVGYH